MSSVAVAADHLAKDRRRKLGAYYTPTSVADSLVKWALPEPGDVLDPSFGGCSFLQASLSRLAALGASNPKSHVFGIDVDDGARPYAARLGLPSSNIVIRDFFDVEPAAINRSGFAAVVGNPPYIRHHWIDGATLGRARSASHPRRTLPKWPVSGVGVLCCSRHAVSPNRREASLPATYLDP